MKEMGIFMEETIQPAKIQNGTELALGVTQAGECYQFCVFLPNIEECELHIYDLKEYGLPCGENARTADEESRMEVRKAAVTLPLSAVSGQPGLFRTSVSSDSLPACWGYRYAAMGTEFMDPYVKHTYGRMHFGAGEEIFGCPRELCLTGAAQKIRQKSRDFDWGADIRPGLAFNDMILYKLHVRGFTMTAPGVKHKGTYRGILEKKQYLTELGINAVLLMPCFEFNEIFSMQESKYQKPAGQEKKVNYWGFGQERSAFVPKASYAAVPGRACTEFKKMVKGLHESGIEVLLEMDFLPADNPNMILDCLCWWVKEYHVDGFRVISGTLPERMLRLHPGLAGVKFLTTGQQDVNPNDGMPVELVRVMNTRLRGGVMPDRTNAYLAEYQDGFQNEMRRFLKGDEEMVGRVFERLLRQNGSVGVINHIADNNGFTLRDLYSYDVKHNEANGEENRDGSDYNFGWNCGAEGETKKKKIQKLRLQMQKNALLLLMLSQGTPMLLAGDEFGNSQQGNNNAYCQDNEIGWLSWKELRWHKDLFEFTKQLIALRKAHPVLHHGIALKGMDYISCGCPDVSRHGTRAWYPDYSNYSRTLGLLLCGRYARVDRKHADCSMYLAVNMHWEPHEFDLPNVTEDEELVFLCATDESCKPVQGEERRTFEVPARSIVVFIGREKVKEVQPRAKKRRNAK